MTTEERLKADVGILATSDGRCVGTAGHDRARAWLVATARRCGLEGYRGERYELPYGEHGATSAGERDDELCNLVARAPGCDRTAPPVLIAAHYDTCGVQPGADDNAAAIAISLECARRLVARPAATDVLFGWFDAEEPPHFLLPSMGSIHFYRHQREESIRCAVVMDLVGHAVPIPERGELLFVTGAESDPALPGVLAGCSEGRLRVMPVLNRYVGDMSDHHVFRTERRPYLFLSCGQWTHYHQASDTPEVLSYPKMAAIADYTEQLVRALAEVELVGPFESGDTTPMELAGARRHLAPLAAHLGNPLLTREDLDTLVGAAKASFGLLPEGR